MNQRVRSLVLIGLLLAMPAIAADTLFPYKTHTETLSNGLTVILIPMSSGGLVDYRSIVRTGSRDEFEPGHTGFAHFFEHMMFRGTENYPAEVYNDMLLALGANFNAFTGGDLTIYIQGIVAEDLETVMKLESDRFQNLSYTQAVFQTEAGAVYGEYRKTRMNPFFTLYEAITQTAFDEHTYGHTTMGYEEDIKAMPTMYEYSKSFFSRYYRPENVVLLIVGDLEVEPTLDLVRKYYGAWKRGYQPPRVTPEPPQTEERRIEVPYAYQSLPLLGIAYKSRAFDSNDRTLAAADLLCELAFGETSELYQLLVLDEQVVEGFFIESEVTRDPGLILLLSRIKDPSKVDYVLAEIDRVIAQARTTPPDPHRLAAVQARFKYDFLMSLDTPSAVADSLTEIVAVTGGIEAVDALYRNYDRVTPEDVVAAAQELFLPTRRTVAVLGSAIPSPRESADAVLLPVPDDPTISFRIWFKVGSQNDPPGKEGLANLTGELLARGATTKNSYEEILEKLYPLASAYEVRVDKEMTTLAGRTHLDNLDAFFEILTDAYLHPAFQQDDFERVRSDQLNLLRTTLRYASDEELGKAALSEFIFEGTGYRHPVFGTVAGLTSVTLEDVRRFYTANYTRENTVVALGGGYPENLVGRLEATLGLLPRGVPAAPPAVDPPPSTGRQVLLVAKSDADASISFGFPIDLMRGERDFYALWIANSFLGEHRTSASHLYQVIREARGMNYGDYSYIEAFPEGELRQMPPPNVGRRQQIFEVWIRTLPNAQAHFALRAAMRELKHLVDHGLTEEQFELARSFISKYYLQYADNTDTRLGYAIDDRFYGIGGEGHLARFGELIPQITREEVNAAIRKYLQYDNVKIAIVTGEAETLRDALVRDTPSPITYDSPKPPEVLEEDKEIAAWPLDIAEDAVRIVAVEEIFEK